MIENLAKITKNNLQILLKIEQKASVKKAKTFLATIIKKLQEQKDFRSVRIILDVDKV